MVKDYQDFSPQQKERLILQLVKKYPLYSLDKLTEKLPGVSRHSVQRILEKNQLSTVKERLEFTSSRKKKIKLPTGKPRAGLGPLPQVFFGGLGGILGRPKAWFLNRRRRKIFVALGVLILVLGSGLAFVLAEPPRIELKHPVDNQLFEGKSLFVTGKVSPSQSQVTVNGKLVSLNGDGTFTAVIDLPMGESILTIKAAWLGKESELLSLVKRELTGEERQAQEKLVDQEKLTASNKAAELDRLVTDMIAARDTIKNPEAIQAGLLKIINNRVEEEAGFQRIVGEVINLGEEPVSWVMVTAQFINEGGNTVDTKYGFATDYGQILKPGETIDFETQVTLKPFDHYNLKIAWESEEFAKRDPNEPEPEVAGEATGSAENLE